MLINKYDKKDKSYTEIEIEGQPTLWNEVYKMISGKEKEINGFLSPLLQRHNLQIILTGAGSSAFIGEAAQALVQKNTGCTTRAIATTDIITHPELIFESKPTLLISFARSGNSPESLETVKLADNFGKEIFHLIITCNKNGELLNYAVKNQAHSYALLLPEASNDLSLAMTGSFTSMLLSVLLISNIKGLQNRQKEVEQIIDQGNRILQKAKAFKEISANDFERVVFLGSGPMLGIARECHLKLQELTDGTVICKHDSFLGFRHGPRAVTNQKTLLVYLFSQKDFVYQYELDLALSIAKDPRHIQCISIGREEDKKLKSCLNINLLLDPDQELNIVPASLVGQILGYYKCLDIGLNPDNPSKSGAISRVVKGVTIYEHPEKKSQ